MVKKSKVIESVNVIKMEVKPVNKPQEPKVTIQEEIIAKEVTPPVENSMNVQTYENTSKIYSMGIRIDKVDARMEDIEARITAFEKRVKEKQDQESTARFNNFNALSDLASAIKSINARCAVIEKELAAMRKSSIGVGGTV